MISGQWKRVLAALLILCLFAGQLFSQEYSHMEQLSVDEGLPHTDVSSIVQDRDGYIWIGTYSGLCRYDGTDMTVCSSEPVCGRQGISGFRENVWAMYILALIIWQMHPHISSAKK